MIYGGFFGFRLATSVRWSSFSMRFWLAENEHGLHLFGKHLNLTNNCKRAHKIFIRWAHSYIVSRPSHVWKPKWMNQISDTWKKKSSEQQAFKFIHKIHDTWIMKINAIPFLFVSVPTADCACKRYLNLPSSIHFLFYINRHLNSRYLEKWLNLHTNYHPCHDKSIH